MSMEKINVGEIIKDEGDQLLYEMEASHRAAGLTTPFQLQEERYRIILEERVRARLASEQSTELEVAGDAEDLCMICGEPVAPDRMSFCELHTDDNDKRPPPAKPAKKSSALKGRRQVKDYSASGGEMAGFIVTAILAGITSIGLFLLGLWIFIHILGPILF